MENAEKASIHLSLTPEEQKQLVQQSLDTFKQWQGSRQKLESTWQECWEAYLGNMANFHLDTTIDENLADRSRINRPVLFEAVESIHANLLNALFPGNEKFFSVEVQKEADFAKAQCLEEYISRKLDETRFIDKFSLFLKQAIITGNSVASIRWKKETRTKMVYEPVEVMGVVIDTQKKLKQVLTFEGPDFEVLDMKQIYIDPNAVDFEHAMIMHSFQRTLQELEATGSYANLTQVREELLKNTKKSNVVYGLKIARQEQEEKILKNSLSPQKINLLELWGDFEINGSVYSNYVCTLTETGHLLRFEANPYEAGLKPFVFTTFIPVPNQMYGIGAIQQALGLQHAINTLTNQKLDVINISINSPFTYLVHDDVFDPNTIVSKPGALIPVKSHDTLRPLQYLNDYTVAFQEIADLKAEIQEATGAFKYFTGAGRDSGLFNRTATEVSALVQGGSQKYSSLLAHLEHKALEPYLTLVFEMAKQFITETQWLNLQKSSGELCTEALSPMTLRTMACQFKVGASQTLGVKNQELEAAVAFLKLVQQNPELAGSVNQLAILKRIYRRLGFKNESEIFLSHLE
jgi:hypothetical protein